MQPSDPRRTPRLPSARIAGVGTALGAHPYPQERITEELAGFIAPDRRQRAVLRRLHAATGVRTRHMALPLPAYRDLVGFTAANDAFLRVATDLAEQAAGKALSAAGLTPADVDLIVTTTVTGLAVPSLDARLVPRLGLRPDVRRVPIVGLGCVAGAAGVARVADLLRGHPDGVALLVASEVCSLTIQRDDVSTANLVASGLFGDGAGAVVLLGRDRAAAMGAAGPDVLASASSFYPDTERTMGWDIGTSGFRVVLSADVPAVVAAHLPIDMAGFLGGAGLALDDVAHWVAHPGGPKVIEAVERSLGLPAAALDTTRRSLAAVGNLSSASVLHVLADRLAACPPGTGEPAVLFAMGPGFCSELVLLRW